MKDAQNCLPLVPILSHKNPTHALPSYFFKIYFNIIPHLHPCFPNELLFSCFPTKTMQASLLYCVYYVPCYLIFNLINHIMYGG